MFRDPETQILQGLTDFSQLARKPKFDFNLEFQRERYLLIAFLNWGELKAM
jgi:hypothetical protein